MDGALATDTRDSCMLADTLRDLTAAEHDVVQLAARGMPTKVIAYELGISSSTVSTRLSRAARKAGLESRHALLRRVCRLRSDGQCAALAELTAAEREILALLQSGLSNREIASLRARSPRTIANQVASVLRKTQCASRRGLLCIALSADHAT